MRYTAPPDVQPAPDRCRLRPRRARARGPRHLRPAARARELVNTRGAQLNAWVQEETARWLDRDRIVGVVGGDHAVPFGAIAAAAHRHPGLGILHLDAHADLREAYEGFTWSHASIMFNVLARLPAVARLVQVGIRDLGEAEHRRIEASGGRVVTFF